LKAEQPSGQEVEVAQEFTPPPAQPTQVAQAQQPPAKLPATGSTLPLVALLGLTFTGTGFLLRFAARRLS
jgi:LPXTG-motif cell wall-anchored protein